MALPRQSLLPFLIVISLGLAGCTADGGGSSTPNDTTNIAAPSDSLEGGVIAGLVLDDESLPVAGAMAGLLELNLQVITDASGAFRFQNLPAGSYRLAVQKLGYESVARGVAVQDADVAEITIVLKPIRVDVAYQEVIGPLNGYFQCRASVYTVGVGTGACGYVCPAVTCVNPWSTAGYNPFTMDNSVLRFNLTSDTVATVVGDMKWTPSAYGTSGAMRFAFSYDKRPGNHWWCSGEGKSPLQFVYSTDGDSRCANVGAATTPAKPAMEVGGLRIYANVPFATTSTPLQLSYEQKFEMYGTIFYGDPAPEGYSALADS